MMKKTILLLPHKDYFYNQYQEYVETFYIFKDIKYKFILGLKRLNFLLFPSLCKIWFTQVFKKIIFTKYDKIILFDSYYSPYVANYIKKRYQEKDVIVFYRNHIDNPTSLKQIKNGIQVWSYDIHDCEKYNIKYNTQFYFTSIKSNITESDKEVYDFFFVGQIKGRKVIIDEVRSLLQTMGYKVFFYVIDEKKENSGNNKYLDYEIVVKLINQSRCVVDLVGPWQKGMTLRPLEALFHKKKLFTNFHEIKGYDFYSANNIFVYGVDSVLNLNRFLEESMDMSIVKYIDKYNFSSWVDRFYDE